MKFAPLTDKEIEEMRLIGEGIYRFMVDKASDTDDRGNPLLTHKGAPKIQLTLRIDDGSALGRMLDCIITPAFAKLLKHFCDVTGLEDKYLSGELTARDCMGKTGFVVVGFREYIAKDKTTGKDKVVKTNQVEDFSNEQRIVGTDDGFRDTPMEDIKF